MIQIIPIPRGLLTEARYAVVIDGTPEEPLMRFADLATEMDQHSVADVAALACGEALRIGAVEIRRVA